MDNRSLQAVIDRWSVGEVSWCHDDITTLLSEINRLRGRLEDIAWHPSGAYEIAQHALRPVHSAGEKP